MSESRRSDRAPRRDPSPNLEGRRLGRYELLRRIASGGMATVYVARVAGVAGFERLVAVKVLHAHMAYQPEFISMFLDEARLAARIHHPNVVATIDIQESESDGFFTAMEYIDGETLGGLLIESHRSRIALPPEVAVRIGLDLLAGLHAAHVLADEHGAPLRLVHRDVSPQNVIVGSDGIARLTDFGVAKAAVRLSTTRDGQLKGKLGYFAPEQITNGETEQRSDLFAAGVVVWEMLCQRRLYQADDNAAILHKVLNERPAPPSAMAASLGAFDRGLDRALARDPNDRFASANDFASALESAARSSVGVGTTRDVAAWVNEVLGERLEARRQAIQKSALAGRSQAERPKPEENLWRSADEEVVTTVTRGKRGSGVERRVRGRRTIAVALAVAAVVLAAGGVVTGRWYLARHRGGVSLRANVHREIAAGPRAIAPGDSDPTVVQVAAPIAPDGSLALTPTIVCRVHVADDGTVRDARVYRSRPGMERFETSALEAVSHYRFRPAQHDGHGVDGSLSVPVSFARVAGTIVRIKGSDTIGGSLGPALAIAFEREHADTRVTVESIGSSTAFVGLLDGSADIGAASRTVGADELRLATWLDVRLREHVLGYDGIAVIVNPANPIRRLTLDQLAGLYTGTVTSWRDVGGTSATVRLIGRPESSGTHVFLRDRVVRHGDSHRNDVFASSVLAMERNEDIVQSVARDADAIAYVSLASVDASVRVLTIATGTSDPGQAPTVANIRDGSYPIARPLLFYTRGRPTGASADFLRFALSPAGQAIVSAHAFVASDSADESTEDSQDVADASVSSVAVPMRVLFDAGSAELTNEARAQLAAVGHGFRHQHARALAVGNADNQEDPGRHSHLAQRRARAVVDFLLAQGASDAAISADPSEADRPVATNATAEGRAANRRVDLFEQNSR